ncbi:MAG: tetratricopeptide repeat protein [Alphaproteobacteria bacterium]|nr:tetratricopeptide repeat protein [Alphaproteobacteria bacterium]
MSNRRLAPEDAERVFSEAMARFESGALDEAAQLCRSLQTSFPKNPSVLQLFGLVELRRGHGDEARAKLARAAELAPEDPETLTNYGAVLAETGRPALAAEVFRKAMALSPDNGAIATNLVIALRAAGQLEEAWAEFTRAAARHQGHVPLLRVGLEIGRAAGDPGRVAAAAHGLAAVLPDQADGHAALGHACLQLGRDAEALDSFERWAAIAPADAAAHNAVGLALQKLRRFDAAVVAHFRALELAPRDGGIMLNLGAALDQSGKIAEAEAILKHAAAVPEKAASASINLGALRLRHHADVAGALAHYEAALAREPELQPARLACGMLHLMRGDFARGFDLLDARFTTAPGGQGIRMPGFLRPRWQGEPLVGKTLLIWHEHNLAADIMALHALPAAIERAAHVIVQTDARLLPLVRRMVPPAVDVIADDPRALVERFGATIDLHAPSGDLVRHLYRSLDAVPARNGWLAADHKRVAEFRARYAAHGPGPIVGLAWRGDPLGDPIHPLPPLEAWQGLLAEPDSVFISLEPLSAGAELQSARLTSAATLVADADLDPEGDLDDLAARISALDLVIGLDSQATRLAAALGVETWLILPPVPGWVWFSGRSDSPWSKRIRVFNAARPGDWEPTIAAVALALAQRGGGG